MCKALYTAYRVNKPQGKLLQGPHLSLVSSRDTVEDVCAHGIGFTAAMGSRFKSV
jgi:hypothetical protein